jgi:hypothetical protein
VSCSLTSHLLLEQLLFKCCFLDDNPEFDHHGDVLLLLLCFALRHMSRMAKDDRTSVVKGSPARNDCVDCGRVA